MGQVEREGFCPILGGLQGRAVPQIGEMVM
jgi:hypothetical protein